MPDFRVGDGWGGSEDYATINLAYAAESGTSYGEDVNFLCLGYLGADAVLGGTPAEIINIFTDSVTYDGSNNSALARAHTLTLSAGNINLFDIAFVLDGAFDIAALTTTTATNSTVKRFHAENPFAGANSQLLRIDGNTPSFLIENGTLDGNGIARGVQHRFDDSADLKNILAINCVTGFAGAGANSKVTDCFAASNTTDYSAIATINTSSSEDLTGTFTGYTTAELVDAANEDYRTKSTSPLATLGTGGSFIGAFLEGGGGSIDVNATLGNISFTSNNATVSVSGVVDVQATLGNISYLSNNASIDLSGSIGVDALVGSISYVSNNANVDVVSGIVVQPVTGSISYSSINQDVSLQGTTNVIGALSSISYTSFSTSVRIGNQWTDTPKAVTNWSDSIKPNTIWTDK